MFEIEKDIPPPAAPYGPTTYGFERLAVGDSFLVPATMEMLDATANRLRWAVKKYRRKHAPATKWRTSVNTKGIRCWRIA